MRVRLAFAVAAHLEPEILIIDEVLAVGDANFQKKCLNKMQDVGQHGRTVLFVSHSMPAITRLCERVILLNEGSLLMDGVAHEVVHSYLHSGQGISGAREWPELMDAPGNSTVRLRSVRIKDENENTCTAVDIRKPVGIEMEYEVLEEGHLLMPYYNILNDEGVKVCTAHDQDKEWQNSPRPIGRYTSTAWIPGNLLNEGTVYVGPAMREFESHIRHFNRPEAVAFQVIDKMEGDSTRGDFAGYLSGVIRPQLQWETRQL
jgi:lipopolysaccharide transport system ATP-binding protein